MGQKRWGKVTDLGWPHKVVGSGDTYTDWELLVADTDLIEVHVTDPDKGPSVDVFGTDAYNSARERKTFTSYEDYASEYRNKTSWRATGKAVVEAGKLRRLEIVDGGMYCQTPVVKIFKNHHKIAECVGVRGEWEDVNISGTPRFVEEHALWMVQVPSFIANFLTGTSRSPSSFGSQVSPYSNMSEISLGRNIAGSSVGTRGEAWGFTSSTTAALQVHSTMTGFDFNLAHDSESHNAEIPE